MSSLLLAVSGGSGQAESTMKWTAQPIYETQGGGAATPLIIRDKAGQDRKIYDDSYAVLFIEEHYSNGWTSPSSEGERSTVLLRKALEARGFHVLIWRDLSGALMRTTLDEILANIGYINDSRLFFYYFGHGAVIGTADDPDGPRTFLVPVDSADPNTDLSGFYHNALPISRLIDIAGAMTLKHAFFALEACQAGGIMSSPLAAPPPPNPLGYVFGDLVKRHVRQFLTAGTAKQEVPPGVFTALLLGALDEGSRNGDGYVTGTDVISYVSRHAPQYTKEYPLDPETRSMPPSGGGDMILGRALSAPVDPGKPSPIPPEAIVTGGTQEATNRVPPVVPPYTPPSPSNPATPDIPAPRASNPAQRSRWRQTYMIDGLQNSWGVIVGSYGKDEAGARDRLAELCAANPNMDFMVVATINPQTRNEHWTLFTAYGLSQASASNLASKSIVKAVKDDAFPSRLEFDPADYLKVADRCDR